MISHHRGCTDTSSAVSRPKEARPELKCCSCFLPAGAAARGREGNRGSRRRQRFRRRCRAKTGMWLRGSWSLSKTILVVCSLKVLKEATEKNLFLSPLVCLLTNVSHMSLECKCILRYTSSLQVDCLAPSSQGHFNHSRDPRVNSWDCCTRHELHFIEKLIWALRSVIDYCTRE